MPLVSCMVSWLELYRGTGRLAQDLLHLSTKPLLMRLNVSVPEVLVLEQVLCRSLCELGQKTIPLKLWRCV